MLPLGYSIHSSACMGVAEDPSVLLVRMLCTPSALSGLLSAWLPAGIFMLWHRSATHLIFILMCSISAAVKQLLPFAQAEGQCEENHSF